MLHLYIAMAVLTCIFGSALFGIYVRKWLPKHHLSDDSVSSIKLAIGLIATVAALVLGLMISSAKGSFDSVRNDLVRNAVNVIALDLTLEQIGPETQPLRHTLKENYREWIVLLSNLRDVELVHLDTPRMHEDFLTFERHLAALVVPGAEQQRLQHRALSLTDDVFAARWLAVMQKQGAIPSALIIVMVCWLAVIFGAFGLFAPLNGTVIIFFFMCALSVSGALFVILEMDTPLDGIISISLSPMRDALARIGP